MMSQRPMVMSQRPLMMSQRPTVMSQRAMMTGQLVKTSPHSFALSKRDVSRQVSQGCCATVSLMS